MMAPVELRTAAAQISFSSPASSTRIRACDDLATDLYSDPWDMSNSADINNYISGDVSALVNPTFSGGLFSATTEAAQAATFYLFSPQIIGTTRSGGRYGQDLNITAARAMKYRQLALRMYTDTAEPTGGVRFIFNRGTDYVPNRTVTQRFPTKAGWHVYRFDMPAIGISTGESSNTSPWSDGSITSLAVMPAASAGSQIKVDYIRLEDPTTCQTVPITYQAGSNADGSRYNLYLDDNNDPLDGFAARLAVNQSATGAVTTINAPTDGLDRGVAYKVLGFVHDDFATLVDENPWDMSQIGDISLSAGFSSLSSNGATLSGTASSSAPSLYLRVGGGGIDASIFKRFSMQLTQSASSNVAIFWRTASGASGASFVTDSNGDGVFELNVGANAAWTGTVTELIVRPVSIAGQSFSIDFVSLRPSSYVTSLAAPVVYTAAGTITQNNPPLISVVRPGQEGGEAFQSWNGNPGDATLTSNLASETDPSYPSESLTGYLPDVRVVEGNRGDFLKGTNLPGNDDPNIYFTFPTAGDSSVIDASSYKNLCVKMLIQRDLDVCLGSIVKPVWLNSDNNFTDTQAAVSIYNRWSGSRWQEYCFDLSQMNLLGTNPQPWAGNITGFRIDPHEFSRDTCGSDGVPTGNPTQTTFMLDWVKLTKDVTADTGSTSILLDTQDGDDSPTVDLYVTTTASASGGVRVASGVPEGKRVYVLPTSGIADGTYYVYAVASDGLNTSSRLASGRLVVRNQGGVARSAPILSLESPTNGQSVCSTIQVKGFSLLTDKLERVTGIELLYGGTTVGVLEPRSFSPAARSAYNPSAYESSNSGFNGSFDTSAWPAGSNVVEVRAYSPDGVITSSGSITVTKVAAGCADPIADSVPAGAPAAMDAPDTSRPTPTPTPTFVLPVIKKAVISKTGVFDLSIRTANDQTGSCALSLAVGAKSNSSFKTVKRLSATSTTYTGRLTKTKIGKGSLKRAYLKVTKSCSYGSGSAKAQIRFAQTPKGKITSLSRLVAHLKKLP